MTPGSPLGRNRGEECRRGVSETRHLSVISLEGHLVDARFKNIYKELCVSRFMNRLLYGHGAASNVIDLIH